MRVNIYHEELTDKVEVVRKESGGVKYIGFRIGVGNPEPAGIIICKPTSDIENLEVEPGMIVNGEAYPIMQDRGGSSVTFWTRADKLDDLHEIFHKLCTEVTVEAEK